MEEKKAVMVGSLDIGKCFNEALEVYKKNILILVLATFLLQAISIFSLLVLAGVLSGGYFWMMLGAMRRENKKVELGDMFRLFNKFFPLMGLLIIESVLVFLGFFLLVIPGILLATMWLYAFFIMIDRNEGVFSSLKGSWAMVRRKGLIANLLVCIIYLILAGVGGWIPGVGWIITLLIMPLGGLVLTSAYLQQIKD